MMVGSRKAMAANHFFLFLCHFLYCQSDVCDVLRMGILRVIGASLARHCPSLLPIYGEWCSE